MKTLRLLLVLFACLGGASYGLLAKASDLIAFGNDGTAVAIDRQPNENGTYLKYSTDSGATWTNVREGDSASYPCLNSNHFNAIKYLGGGDASSLKFYIAVGDGGQICTSVSGVIWYLAKGTGSINFYDVTYGKASQADNPPYGTFVAVGDDGWLYFSTDDAQTWHGAQPKEGAGQPLRSVAFGGGTFVAVGDDSTIWYSTTVATSGITWSSPTVGGETTFYRVIYATDQKNPDPKNPTGGQFVVVGSDTTILSSPNGSTWTPSTVVFNNQPYSDLTEIAYRPSNGRSCPEGDGYIYKENSLFVALSGASAVYSCDGQHWWANPFFFGPISADPKAIIYSDANQMFLVAANLSTYLGSNGGNIVYSTDGKRWGATATIDNKKITNIANLAGLGFNTVNKNFVATPAGNGFVITATDPKVWKTTQKW